MQPVATQVAKLTRTGTTPAGVVIWVGVLDTELGPLTS